MFKRTFLANLVLLLLVSVVAEAEEIQAPVFTEGDFWKFKIVQKPVPGFSSTANEFPNGTFILRHDTNARMQLREIIGEKKIFPESPTYRGYILSILGLRQPRSSPTIFNKNLLPFPLLCRQTVAIFIQNQSYQRSELRSSNRTKYHYTGGQFPGS